MAYYVNVGGKHQVREGNELVVYKTGDVVKSSEDLTQKFKNKFQKATTDDVRAFKKMQLRQEEEAARAAEEDQKLEAKIAKQAEYEGDEDEEVEESRLGVDVTDEFDGADGAELKIFKQGRHYNIAKADKPERAVSKGKELTKAEVRSYVKDHAPEETEEVENEEAESEEDEG